MYLVTVGGMGGKLVRETLLMLSRGIALIASDTCLSIGRSVIFCCKGSLSTGIMPSSVLVVRTIF